MMATSEGVVSPVMREKDERGICPLLVSRSTCRSACVTQTMPVNAVRPARNA